MLIILVSRIIPYIPFAGLWFILLLSGALYVMALDKQGKPAKRRGCHSKKS